MNAIDAVGSGLEERTVLKEDTFLSTVLNARHTSGTRREHG